MRILYVAFLGRFREQQAVWYSWDHKLHDALIRAGHVVLPFSARDVAREQNPFGRQKWGRTKTNQILLQTAAHFKPDLIIIGHADLITMDCWRELKQDHPNASIMQFNVDWIYGEKAMANFRARAEVCDFNFITTADRAILELVPDPARISFIPNPIDPARDQGRAFAEGEQTYDALFIGRGEGREAMLQDIRNRLPEAFTWRFGGGMFNSKALFSSEYMLALQSARMAPNLPRDFDRPAPYLYSSDRIGQIFGNGLLAFLHRESGLTDLYGDDGAVYFDDIGDLAEKLDWYRNHDSERRKLAEAGWLFNRANFTTDHVAEYLLQTVEKGAFPDDRLWPRVQSA